jgi:rRNA-processing protein FCF1
MVAHRSWAPSRLVIDTNILLLLAGYKYLDSAATTGQEKHRRLLELRGRDGGLPPTMFDDLWQFVHQAKQRIITQHVLAETYNLSGRGQFPKGLFWKSALELLSEFDIEEYSCPIRDLRETQAYEGILSVVGPSDTGLLHTAEHQKATIVSDDFELRRYADQRAVPILALNEISARW